MNEEIVVDYWFPTPIWKSILDVDEKTTKEAREFCLQLHKKSDGVVKSNRGGWHSDLLLLREHLETPIIAYFLKIEVILKNILDSIKSNKNFILDNFWINVNHKDHFNIKHYHPNSFLSGVFYLTDNNSDIVFERARDTSVWMLEYAQVGSKLDFANQCATYKPLKNSLLIFPSWLEHRVEPSKEETPRISIAFNVYIQN